jgi:hypothetical protein
MRSEALTSPRGTNAEVVMTLFGMSGASIGAEKKIVSFAVYPQCPAQANPDCKVEFL